jgi:hypothetical protein
MIPDLPGAHALDAATEALPRMLARDDNPWRRAATELAGSIMTEDGVAAGVAAILDRA